MYRVYVRDGTGEEFVIRLPEEATLKDLKFQLFEVTGISPDYYKLIFNGKNLMRLNDWSSLHTQAGIVDGSVVKLVITRDVDEIENLQKALELRSVQGLKKIIERGNLPDINWPHAYGNTNDTTGALLELMIGAYPGIKVSNISLDHENHFKRSLGADQSEEQFLMAGMDPSFPYQWRGRTTVLNPPDEDDTRIRVTPDAFAEAGATVGPNWKAKHYKSRSSMLGDYEYDWFDFLYSLGFS